MSDSVVLGGVLQRSAEAGSKLPQWAPEFLFQADPIIWVQQFFGLGHPLPFRLIDLFASTWGVLFAIGLALWLWERQDAYALGAIVLIEAVINFGLNQFLSVPRPSDPSIVKYEHIGLGSFPSGHAFTITVLWGLLWVRDRVPFWLSALLIVGVGVGRLYLGVHYLADVVAGVILGILLVWLFHAIWPPIRGWLAQRSYGFFVGAGGLGVAAVAAGLFLLSGKSFFMWNAAGMAAGGIIALLIEYRLVHYRPIPSGAIRAAARIVIGLLGIVPLLAAERLTGEQPYQLGAVLVLAGTLWTLLAVPALFTWWGWSRQDVHLRDSQA